MALTEQELADAIREHYGARRGMDNPGVIGDLVKALLIQHPPAVPESPCTIDQVPGWTVHVDARGEQFAFWSDEMTFTAVRRPVNPDGVRAGVTVHPWPVWLDVASRDPDQVRPHVEGTP